MRFDDDYIHAKPTLYDDIDFMGGRGFRLIDDQAQVSAGAGGGYSESLYGTRQIIDMDGRGLNMTDNFAEGGMHCLDGHIGVPAQLMGCEGGFGGGGGGCLEGGGGGGFTGGNVENFTMNTPGSGGYSFNAFTEFLDVPENYSLNYEDGYVDIIPADCGCVYECVVYEEEDQFECLCPNGTKLAPDLSDCYSDDKRNVTVTNIAVADGDEDFILTAVTFETHLLIFSVNVGLGIEQDSVKRDTVTESEDVCALLFVGKDDDIVLLANPVKGSGRATSLSRIIDSGTLSATAFTEFLHSSVLVTGAILASTGVCIIEDVISFNKSTQTITSEDAVNFTKIATDLYNTSSKSNAFLKQVLGISESDIDEEGDENDTESFSYGIVVVIILASLVAVGVCAAFTVFLIKWLKRSPFHRSTADFPLNLESGTKNQVIFHAKQSSMQSNPQYEVLHFDDIDGDIEKYVPLYNLNSTTFEFTDYNKSRSDTGISEWEYPRSHLVFMRDLGEGQFGKVMLMKATDIAGHSGDLPVAVKTLGSRDPAIIQKFMDETELMKRFSHPNIVSLLGVCNMSVKEDSAPLMILEYMPYGDLHKFLSAHRPTKENVKSLIAENHFYNFATDVANALEFLSSHKYVHRDVAARNCLVGVNLSIKIADFGLARGVCDKDYYRVAGHSFLPVRWMAPECLLYGIFSSASDVWAYGVLLWEITSYGLTPLNQYEAREVIQMAENGALKHIQPTTCPGALYSIICECHAYNREERPSFTHLLQLLATHKKVKELHNIYSE